MKRILVNVGEAWVAEDGDIPDPALFPVLDDKAAQTAAVVAVIAKKHTSEFAEELAKAKALSFDSEKKLTGSNPTKE